MKTRIFAAILILGFVAEAQAQTLRGSKAAMEKQHQKAVELELTRLENGEEVEHFARLGILVELFGDENYELDVWVSYPYTRPTVKLFVERLSKQYREACSEKLVVTSLTRPADEQPWNASPISVHPYGLSVDLRTPENKPCRKWLEATLLSLEKQDLVDAGRESNPPHYHVAVFIDRYRAFVTETTSN